MCWTNSDCLHCVCEKRERRERTHALRMRAHDHFVSQKMTDCSSPKEESLPIQNRNRAWRLQNARDWNQNGESQSDIDGEFADQSISRTLRVKIF